MVAQKIKALIDEVRVHDKGANEERPLSYRDIVLLTPTKNNLVILEIFKDFQIPVI